MSCDHILPFTFTSYLISKSGNLPQIFWEEIETLAIRSEGVCCCCELRELKQKLTKATEKP